ncbi:MAG: pyrroline-5-carboxylate reductase [Candidatus Izemoplasma sp.]
MSKIGFIGCGNIATAMLTGLSKSDDFINDNLFVFDNDSAKLKTIQSKININIAKSNIDLVNQVDFLVLAVKPKIYPLVIEEIKNTISKDTVVITLAPGILIKDTKRMFDQDIKVIRTMPNTPALVGEGITALCPSSNVTTSDEQTAVKMFNSFGKSVKLAEDKFDAFTAVCGSSPAFVYMFIEAMAKGGLNEGLPKEIIYDIVSQAVLGSAKMVLVTKDTPQKLINDVSTPGGTTVVGTADLRNNNFEEIVISAIAKTTARSSQPVK